MKQGPILHGIFNAQEWRLEELLSEIVSLESKYAGKGFEGLRLHFHPEDIKALIRRTLEAEKHASHSPQ